MIKPFLRSAFISTVLGCATISSNAQGSYGNSKYFNFTYASLTSTEWASFTTNPTFKAKADVDGDTILFGGTNALGATRAKGGYTGAVKATYAELQTYPSMGYLSVYVQNGSSGSARNLYIKYWDDLTSAWITAETYVVGGSGDLRFIFNSVFTKRAVKVRIDSDGPYFWFHQIEAWSHKKESANASENPKILSFDPVAGTVIPSTGTINVQLDEIIKAGTGNPSFSGGTITPVYKGSVLQLGYSGLSKAKDTLKIPATYVVNKGNLSLNADTAVIYANDVTDPTLVSVAPVDGSKIHINDIAGKITFTFDENIALGTGTISFGPAIVTPTVSDKTLVLAYSGLAYSTSYTLAIPANMIKDISGNTLKTDISVKYLTNDRDNTPPTLLSQSIADGAINQPIGGSISFTFSEIVQKNKIDVTLNGIPAIVSFNGAMMGLSFTNLEYNKEYTVSIPQGAISDTTGNFFFPITYKFTTKAFATKALDKIVAKDGSGDFTTIQAAITSVPDNSSERTFIYIKNGTYNEKVLIPATKINVSLIGQDSAKTILTYNDYAGGAGGTDNSYTIDVKATGFYAENITIKNTWDQTGGSLNQAVALMTEGDMQVYKNVRAYSFQDTHYPKTANTRNYYSNCFIQGATDFMFGSGTAYFESSTINCVNGGQYITAPSGTTKEFGLVYNNCSITANANVASQAYFLGRPWKDFGKTVWLNTKMGAHVKDIGWAVWTSTGDDADNHLTGYYGEYNSMNLAGTAINPIRATWGKILNATQASRYTIDNVFNFGTGSNTWNPLPYSTAPEAPMNVALNGNLSWDAVKFAVGYVVFRNDTLIGSTIAPSFTDLKANENTNVYKVKAINEYGAQSLASNSILTSLEKESFGFNASNSLYPNPFSEVIMLKNADKVESVEFYNNAGILIKKSKSGSIIKTDELPAGFYTVKVIAPNAENFSIKMIKK